MMAILGDVAVTIGAARGKVSSEEGGDGSGRYEVGVVSNERRGLPGVVGASANARDPSGGAPRSRPRARAASMSTGDLTRSSIDSDPIVMAEKRTKRVRKRPKLPAWTPEVTARAQLAKLLLTQHPERARAAGLVLAELKFLFERGEEARLADDLQKSQLAMDVAQRGMQKDLREDVYAREEVFMAKLIPVTGSLVESACAKERQLGEWLSHLSFARYRFRKMKPEVAEGEEVEKPVVKRVLRTDMTTRMTGLAAFCEAILEEGREPIIRAFEERTLPRGEIERLASDARRLAKMGPNVKRPVPATLVEAEAVRAQSKLWSQLRKLVQNAVAGVPELERRLRDC